LFISNKYGSSISGKFWSHGAHIFCFYILVAIFDPPGSLKLFSKAKN
jgi:hypothetical protein